MLKFPSGFAHWALSLIILQLDLGSLHLMKSVAVVIPHSQQPEELALQNC